MQRIGSIIVAAIVCVLLTGCPGTRERAVPIAATGVREATAEVKVGADGLTSEQRNIKERLKQDNQPGAIKHLYIFSTASGQCILYSTVREKVTSSGKRLSPTTTTSVQGKDGDYYSGVEFEANGKRHWTNEMIQDDGTYGKSIEYLYWFDSAGTYRQVYPNGGMMIVVSTTPLPVKSVTVNIEKKDKE